MAGAAGPAAHAMPAMPRAVLLPALLLLAAACLAPLARCDVGVEVDEDGAELPPKRFPSGPNLDKLRLHVAQQANDTTRALGALGPAVAAAVNGALNQTTAGTAAPPAAATARPFLEPTKSAAVLIAVFVCVALGGYFGLLVWRRVLERKYGNREILVNEEHFEQDSIRDLRNFQL